MVIFEDKDFLIINKPAHLRAIRDGYDPALPHLASVLEKDFGRVWIVHRLDKGTSGVMVLARNAKAHQILNDAFAERKTNKLYQAILTTCPAWHELWISLPLRKDADRFHRTRVDYHQGKGALTHITMQKNTPLAHIHLFTGYTQQIRAHLFAVGCCLRGDDLYQHPSQPQIACPRMALHAALLAFPHPRTGELVQFTVEPPEDFLQLMG